MMASRIYRKLSSSNFLKKSVYTNFHQQQTSLTTFNKKLASQNLTKPYSQNHHSDYYSHSQQLLFVKGGSNNLTQKSVLSHLQKYPYGIQGNPRFLSTEKSGTQNHELEMMGPSVDGDELALEKIMKSVYCLSMISGGIGVLNLGWIWLTAQNSWAVDPVVFLAFGIPFSVAYMMKRNLKMMYLIKNMEEQGRLHIITQTPLNTNKALFVYGFQSPKTKN